MKNTIANFISTLLVLALIIIMTWSRFDLESFNNFFKLSNIPISRASFFACSILLFFLVLYPRKSKKSQETGFTRKANSIQNMFLLVLAFGALFLAITGYDF